MTGLAQAPATGRTRLTGRVLTGDGEFAQGSSRWWPTASTWSGRTGRGARSARVGRPGAIVVAGRAGGGARAGRRALPRGCRAVSSGPTRTPLSARRDRPSPSPRHHHARGEPGLGRPRPAGRRHADAGGPDCGGRAGRRAPRGPVPVDGQVRGPEPGGPDRRRPRPSSKGWQPPPRPPGRRRHGAHDVRARARWRRRPAGSARRPRRRRRSGSHRRRRGRSVRNALALRPRWLLEGDGRW